MSSNMILPIHEVLETYAGAEERDRIFQEAGLKFLPSPQDPVRERLVAQLHQGIRRDLPEIWRDIMVTAGEKAAQVVLDYRLDASARDLLRRLPWSLATWMLVRTTTQSAWTFSGSGDFRVLRTSMLEISNNPVTRSEHSDVPVCLFQQPVLENVFARAVDIRLRCQETQCCAAGGESCRFELSMA